MSLCRAWRHDACTEPGRCDCWCHADRMTANPSERWIETPDGLTKCPTCCPKARTA